MVQTSGETSAEAGELSSLKENNMAEEGAKENKGLPRIDSLR